jgi:hypothetical protein
MKILVGGHRVHFSQEASRWLGVWPTRLQKARAAEARIRSLCRTQGLAPGLVRRIQIAAVQAVALYGAELWWQGQKDRQAQLQLLINRRARAITWAYRTTPIGAVREVGLEPAGVVLQARQLGYVKRLLSLPRSHPGHRILLETFRQGDL